jgi:nitroreductase
MDLLEAIRTRKSIRAFTDRPVPLDTVREILEIAQRAPSGTNTQPWHVHVCAGEVKAAITRDVLAEAKAGGGTKYEDHDYYPPRWKDIHRDRRRGVGWALYGLLGIQKGDREASMRQALKNYEFFGAPVGLFITVDGYLGRGSWADAGMYIQTIMLAARAFGLHTCPQAAWITHQEPIFRHLEIPEDQSLVSGMAMGYADPYAIENTLVSDREALKNVARFKGF